MTNRRPAPPPVVPARGFPRPFRGGGGAVLLVAAAIAPTTAFPADPPRSIIQPAGELAAAARGPATGLVTSRAPDVLRDQLGLEGGAGLVVDEVQAGSVAEAAGIRRHDVLVSFDGERLVIPEQLSALVAATPPGARPTLEIRRGGKSLGIPFAAAPAPRAEPAVQSPPAAAPAAPPAAASTTPADGGDPAGGAATAAVPRPAFVPPPGARRLGPDAVVLEDRDCRLKVYRDSDTRLSMRDGRGWLVFNGPIATPQQRSLIPRRVRERVEMLEAMLDAVEVDPNPPAVVPPAPAQPVVAAPRRPEASPPPPPATAREVTEIGTLDVAPIEIR